MPFYTVIIAVFLLFFILLQSNLHKSVFLAQMFCTRCSLQFINILLLTCIHAIWYVIVDCRVIHNEEGAVLDFHYPGIPTKTPPLNAHSTAIP